MDTRSVSGVIGIVLGPPEGSRGSTGWGHLSRRAPWVESGGEPAPSGLGCLLGPPPHAPRVGNPRGEFPLALGGKATPFPLGRRPPNPRWVLAGSPSQGGIYKGGEGGQQPTALGASLLPCNTSLSLSQKLGEALPETRYIHHHAVVLTKLSFGLSWIKSTRDVTELNVCRSRRCRAFGA